MQQLAVSKRGRNLDRNTHQGDGHEKRVEVLEMPTLFWRTRGSASRAEAQLLFRSQHERMAESGELKRGHERPNMGLFSVAERLNATKSIFGRMPCGPRSRNVPLGRSRLSCFSVFTWQFRENAIGNRFWDSLPQRRLSACSARSVSRGRFVFGERALGTSGMCPFERRCS